MAATEKQSSNLEVVRTDDIKVSEDITFSKFLLSDEVLAALESNSFVKPSPIQLKGIPLARCGLDMIVQAKSGTGKTLLFSIVLLEQFDIDLLFPQALVIVPTREIAVQIVSFLTELGKTIKHFKASSFIGGTDFTADRKTIQTCKVVVGTPGRILHLIRNEIFNVSCLKTVVLDEADKLIAEGDLGKDVSKIIKLIKRKIQIIATTATITEEMETLLKKIMKNPIGITPKHEVPVLIGIKQFVSEIPASDDNIKVMLAKIEELKRIFSRIPFKQCLLFTDSHMKTVSYGNYLNKGGWPNEVINGSLEQSERLEVLKKLQSFKCRILITTDLMARGIDIENINLIINLDPTNDPCTYLHRIGRAGRFGTHGIAISLVTGEKEMFKFQQMLTEIGGSEMSVLKLPKEQIPDLWDFSSINREVEKETFGTIQGIIQEEKVLLNTDNCFANGFTVNSILKSSDQVNGESSSENLEKSKDDIKQTKEKDDIIKNNVALFELTKLLVDSDVPKAEFNMSDILDDYENSCLKKTEIVMDHKPETCAEKDESLPNSATHLEDVPDKTISKIDSGFESFKNGTSETNAQQETVTDLNSLLVNEDFIKSILGQYKTDSTEDKAEKCDPDNKIEVVKDSSTGNEKEEGELSDSDLENTELPEIDTKNIEHESRESGECSTTDEDEIETPEDKISNGSYRKVIFVRPEGQAVESDLSDSSEEDEEKEVEPEKSQPKFKTQRRPNKPRTQPSPENTLNHPNYSYFNQFADAGHEKWQNIYLYQLASINSYLNFQFKK